jgi:hypothetical protein
MTHILVATDAWHPQVNGVVRTLTAMAEAAKGIWRRGEFPDAAIVSHLCDAELSRSAAGSAVSGKNRKLIEAAKPDSIHIATEARSGFWCGAIAASAACRSPRAFTPVSRICFGAFADPGILGVASAARLPPAEPGGDGGNAGAGAELRMRGFRNVVLWSRGVDTSLFHPRSADLCLPMPVFLCVGRVAVEKNLEAFLDLDLPGTKLVVGDGPARRRWSGNIRMPCSWVPGTARNSPKYTRPPTFSCFPARPTHLAWYCWRRWPVVCRLPPFRSAVHAT